MLRRDLWTCTPHYANEPQFASVKEEALPLPESLDWRCAPQMRRLERRDAH